jgi:tetratricopeptide (TPR) repeat protein
LRLSPDDVEALNNRGLVYDALQDYEKAMEDYAAAAALQPDFAEALNNWGAALEALGDDIGALGQYLAATRAAPDFAAAYFNAARLYSRQGELEEALKFLDLAAGLDPQWAEEAAEDEHLGWALELQGLKERRSREN